MPADIACVSFEYSDSVRLMFGPPEVSHCCVKPSGPRGPVASAASEASTRRTLLRRLPLDPDRRPRLAQVCAQRLPWIATSSESATVNRWMVATILQTMSAAGWRVIASPMVGKTIKRCDDLFFVRRVPNAMPFVSVALWSYDSILVVAPTNIGKPVVEAVRGAIASHWPQGIQRQKATGIMSKFKLKGYPWQMNNKDAVDARLLVKHIIEAMHAAGYDLVTCNGVEPWRYDSDSTHHQTDTMFFQMRSAGPPLQSSLPSYEESVGGPSGSGGMGGPSQSVSPFPQPVVDMSNLALLAIDDADSILLFSTQSQILSPVVLQIINTVLPKGLQYQRTKMGAVYIVPWYKLQGIPFACNGTDSVTSKRLIVTLLARFANYGLRFVADITTKRTTQLSSFAFGNAPPVRRAPHFCLALNDVNKIRLIAPNYDDPNALTIHEMQHVQSVIVGTMRGHTHWLRPERLCWCGRVGPSTRIV
ncbi:hypothetical protein BC831DRAFT_145158 [Entophlyctis helioformis]|nr:hypothetical protein BC831DRAFT_145158 [Entophlyctis helioformis]